MEEIEKGSTKFGGVCVVVPVRNEAASIRNVVRQLHRAGVRTCVIVVNGSTDETPHCAREVAARCFDHFRIVQVFEALGPDVPKALGTYVGLRDFPHAEWFLYVDGDWKGSFGPMLNTYLQESIESGEQVHWVGVRDAERQIRLSGSFPKEDERFWHPFLAKYFPNLQRAAISRSPLLVRRQVFHDISPYWLYHPGIWFALCARKQAPKFRLRVNLTWDTKLVGNPTRSRDHAQKMSDTLLGDALEGYCLLSGRKPSRTWNGRSVDGYNSHRRIDLLRQWQTQL